MTPGTEFIAKSKCNNYHYRLTGFLQGPGITYSICLLNLDTNVPCCVEPAWFDERKITVTKEV